MKSIMFSLYDTKLEAFMRPFFLQTVGVARRAIVDLAHDSSHEASKHPSDYCLYELGTFDDHSSEVIQMLPPKRVGLVSEIVTNYDAASNVPRDYVHGQTTVGDETPVLRSTSRGDSS